MTSGQWAGCWFGPSEWMVAAVVLVSLGLLPSLAPGLGGPLGHWYVPSVTLGMVAGGWPGLARGEEHSLLFGPLVLSSILCPACKPGPSFEGMPGPTRDWYLTAWIQQDQPSYCPALWSGAETRSQGARGRCCFPCRQGWPSPCCLHPQVCMWFAGWRGVTANV